MKPTTLFLLSFSSTALASGNSTSSSSSSPDSQCAHLAKLTSLAALATDPAALAEKSQGDPALAAQLQTEAAAAVPELAALQADAALQAQCSAVTTTTTTSEGGWGGGQGWDECKKLERLRQQVALGANATAVEGEKGEKWGERVRKAEKKLRELEANGTLVAECAAKGSGGVGGGAGAAAGTGAAGAGVASPTGSTGSAGSTGGVEPDKTPDASIVSGVSGLVPVGNTLGLLGVVLFGALLL